MDPKSTAAASTKISRTSSGGGSGTIILDKYQLTRLLGRGSFAKVYHARSLKTTTTEVAIKIIDKATIVDADMIIREVSAMRRLQHHPNILKLHEVMATKSKIYLVMDLAPGGELLAKLRGCRRFSDSTARKYFQQVVSALRFCHQNGVVHRDIKPQNLLLDDKGVLKITDFGLSALLEHRGEDGLIQTACGTPAYSAPEVVYRKGYDGEKADAWSCGVLLYLFLVGRLPFDDSNLSNMYRAMHRRGLDFPDWVSKPAKNVISRLMDPNPSTRMGLGELINHSWYTKKSSKTGTTQLETISSSPEELGNCNEYLNAFDIISMSSGLDLSGLLETKAQKNRKEMRFTCGVQQVVEIEEKVVKVGVALGYMVSIGKGGGLGLVKGRVILVVDIWQVAVGLWFVEVRLVDDGGVEFGQLHWNDIKTGLADIVLSWHNEVVVNASYTD